MIDFLGKLGSLYHFGLKNSIVRLKVFKSDSFSEISRRSFNEDDGIRKKEHPKIQMFFGVIPDPKIFWKNQWELWCRV